MCHTPQGFNSHVAAAALTATIYLVPLKKIWSKWQIQIVLFFGSWTRENTPLGERGTCSLQYIQGAPVPLTKGALWAYYHGSAWTGREHWIKSKNINSNQLGSCILLHIKDWPSHLALIVQTTPVLLVLPFYYCKPVKFIAFAKKSKQLHQCAFIARLKLQIRKGKTHLSASLVDCLPPTPTELERSAVAKLLQRHNEYLDLIERISCALVKD